MRLFSAAYYTIKLPVSRKLPPISPTLVTTESPYSLRRCVETLAYYFKRELHFDFSQFEASESPTDSWYVPYEVWAFHDEAIDEARNLHDEPRRVIGAACFRRRANGHTISWALQWVWFHPYERRRGHLTRCWQLFLRRYGAFDVERPLSDAMMRFLSKHADDHSESSLRARHRK
jgi:hypothetical protein